MEFSIGNNIFLEVEVCGNIGRYNFQSRQSAEVYKVEMCKDVVVVHIKQNHETDDIKLNLKIYNSDDKRKQLRIERADGCKEDFILSRSGRVDVRSFGNNGGDFYVVTSNAPEAVLMEKEFSECNMLVTTWEVEDRNERIYTGLAADRLSCRTATDGSSSSAISSVTSKGFFATKGSSSQHFNTVDHKPIKYETRKCTVLKFLLHNGISASY